MTLKNWAGQRLVEEQIDTTEDNETGGQNSPRGRLVRFRAFGGKLSVRIATPSLEPISRNRVYNKDATHPSLGFRLLSAICRVIGLGTFVAFGPFRTFETANSCVRKSSTNVSNRETQLCYILVSHRYEGVIPDLLRLGVIDVRVEIQVFRSRNFSLHLAIKIEGYIRRYGRRSCIVTGIA